MIWANALPVGKKPILSTQIFINQHSSFQKLQKVTLMSQMFKKPRMPGCDVKPSTKRSFQPKEEN